MGNDYGMFKEELDLMRRQVEAHERIAAALELFTKALVIDHTDETVFVRVVQR